MYRLLSECSNLFEISFPARYRNETVEAEVYYKQALQLVPTNGIHMHAYVLNLMQYMHLRVWNLWYSDIHRILGFKFQFSFAKVSHWIVLKISSLSAFCIFYNYQGLKMLQKCRNYIGRFAHVFCCVYFQYIRIEMFASIYRVSKHWEDQCYCVQYTFLESTSFRASFSGMWY
jgi:hypothetical protein